MSGQGSQRGGADVPVQSLVAAEGDVVELSVDDLPGAGYRWTLRAAPDGLRLLPEDQATSAAPSEKVGGSARRTVTVRAERAGSYLLDLALIRPWEADDVPPAATRQVSLTVFAGGPGGQ